MPKAMTRRTQPKVEKKAKEEQESETVECQAPEISIAANTWRTVILTVQEVKDMGESLLVPGHMHYATPVFEGCWELYWEALTEKLNEKVGRYE